jgi:SAM-dependent methyltransferase
VYTNPRVADADLGALYDDDYYRGMGFDPAVDYAGPVDAWTRAENERIVRTIEAALERPIAGVRWLDFGCGTGTLLERVRIGGGDALGFDDSPAAMGACESRGIPTLTQTQIAELRGAFDVVSAVEVIEHVPDPIGFLRTLRDLVKPGGVVYVHTENWNVVRRLPGTGYLMPEGHIQYFTPASMRRAFDLAGLTEVSTFDRCWFVWRRLPGSVRMLIPDTALPALRAALVRLVPGFAPFPVGRRPL